MNRRGSGLIWALIIVIVLVIFVAVIWYSTSSRTNQPPAAPSVSETSQSSSQESITQTLQQAIVPTGQSSTSNASEPTVPSISIIGPSSGNQWTVGSDNEIQWKGAVIPQSQSTFLISYGPPNMDGKEFVITESATISKNCTVIDATNYNCNYSWTPPATYTGPTIIYIEVYAGGKNTTAYSPTFSIVAK